MHNLFVEKHALDSKPLSLHLAQHLCAHGPRGKVVVVANDPKALLAATRKQWLKLIRQAQNERSGTLNAARIDMFTQQILWMQSLSFTSKAPDDLPTADITFATAEDLVRVPPVCQCVYVTYAFECEKLYMLTSWMSRNSLVVIYEQV